MADLNPKQLRFVELYQLSVAGGQPNATQAYMEAYGQTDARAARAAAARLLARGSVQQLLRPAREAADTARAERVRGIEITRDRIRLEMARLAFVDPRRFFKPDGSPKSVVDLDEDTAAALAAVEVEERGVPGSEVVVRTTKIKLWDKGRALASLADTEPGVWAGKDSSGGASPAPAGNVNVNVVNVLPAPAAVAGFLRDLGLPCPGDVLPDGAGEPVDRRAGV